MKKGLYKDAVYSKYGYIYILKFLIRNIKEFEKVHLRYSKRNKKTRVNKI